jgi:methylenetetrahydrofolate reductase (NADPH)
MHVADAYRKKKPVISMEFFPFRDEETAETFNSTVDDLATCHPDYLSVTFGAGGSTKDGSFRTVSTIKKEKKLPCVAYMAGYGLDPENLTILLERYRSLGVKTVFVIRGDQPKSPDFIPHPDSFPNAAGLISFIKGRFDFTLGCAGYPEGHMEAQSLEKDIEVLKLKVDNGAQYVVTQYFYDNDYFFSYLEKCRKAGISVPIVPGIMPVYTVAMTRALAKTCGTTITTALQQKLDEIDAGDKSAVLELGIDFAVQQCKELLRGGVDGLHFYTMNRNRSTKAIIHRLKQEHLL